MEQQKNQTTAVSTTQKTKVDILKGILNAPSVIEQFDNALKDNKSVFIASIIDLYNSDSALQECNPKAVVMECLKAATLKLPINKNLGYAYVIPFNNSVKNANGGWDKVMVPAFQMGYKGYNQLAMRTGQYRTLNADVVYEGEIRKVDKLSGTIAFDGEKKSDKIIGYFCHFELLNGFSKTLYMTVEQVANHAKRYSKGLKKDTTVESLIALANVPFNAESKSVGWLGNFHDMALKTTIRLLLSKYGYLSVEMQSAVSDDINGEKDEKTTAAQSQVIDIDAEVVGDNQREGQAETLPPYLQQ